MKDGWFSIMLKARGLTEFGTMRISGFHAVGRCPKCKVRGEITSDGPTLEAVMTVRMMQPHSPSQLIPASFSMSMSGEGSDDQFTIHGVGPLGLIVELVGRSTSAVHYVPALSQTPVQLSRSR